MFCTKCGKENEERNKFCFSCGKKLVSEKVHIISSIPNSNTSLSDAQPVTPNKVNTVDKFTGETKRETMPLKHKVYIGIFVVAVLVIGYFDGKSKASSQSVVANKSKSHTTRLLKSEMKDVCKSYISQNFRKPENIITTKYLKKDLGVNFISASYVRSSDNSKWEYVCSITGNKIIWASIREDGSVGRWRYEDSREIINGRVKY